MTNTDMILWTAGTTSSVKDLWSTSHNTPVTDTTNNLNSTIVTNSNSTVSFSTTRLMDTKDSQDYAVAYDVSFPMIYAYSYPGSSSFSQHKGYGYFSLQFNTPVAGSNHSSITVA